MLDESSNRMSSGMDRALTMRNMKYTIAKKSKIIEGEIKEEWDGYASLLTKTSRIYNLSLSLCRAVEKPDAQV